MEVEFLGPPMLKALAERLRDRERPQIHVVHFDGHGVYHKEVGLGYLSSSRRTTAWIWQTPIGWGRCSTSAGCP